MKLKNKKDVTIISWFRFRNFERMYQRYNVETYVVDETPNKLGRFVNFDYYLN